MADSTKTRYEKVPEATRASKALIAPEAAAAPAATRNYDAAAGERFGMRGRMKSYSREEQKHQSYQAIMGSVDGGRAGGFSEVGREQTRKQQ